MWYWQACGGQGAAAVTPVATSESTINTRSIGAEGRLEPLQSVELSFGIGGEVAEVLKKEGDTVNSR